ncbi:unannotated protein [freshwater metagenome]|uniref:Unannotated protein n=1 Tax=freshwater metagenome TaxID=449393 RepID=A0A6J7KZW4_9ZZZZ
MALRIRARKTLIGAALATSAIVLTACSSTGAEAPASSSAASPSESSAATTQEITIGSTLPLTGTGAAYGKSMLEGLQLGLKDAEGLLKNVKFNLKSMDSQAQAGPAVTEARQLMGQDGAKVVVTAYSAPPMAQLPIAEQYKVPLLNGGGNTPDLAGNTWLFNDAFMVEQGGKAMMTYAHDTLGIKKVSVLIDTNYPQSTAEAFKTIWTDLSGEAPPIEFIAFDATDAGPVLDKLLASNPDALYVAAGGTTLELILTQLEQRSLKIPFLSNDGAVVGTKSASTVSFPIYYANPAKGATQALKDSYKAVYGAEPDFLAVQNYNLGRIIGAAVGKLIEAGKEITGENLQALFNDPSQTFAVDGGDTSFSSRHIAAQDAAVIKVEGGKSTEIATGLKTT